MLPGVVAFAMSPGPSLYLSPSHGPAVVAVVPRVLHLRTEWQHCSSSVTAQVNLGVARLGSLLHYRPAAVACKIGAHPAPLPDFALHPLW